MPAGRHRGSQRRAAFRWRGPAPHRLPHDVRGARVHRPGPGQRDRAQPRPRAAAHPVRIGHGARPVADLPRGCPQGRQDRRHARRGRPPPGRGTDVVVGLCETHDRPPRRRSSRAWRSCPASSAAYRGTTLSEMDLDAVLARRSQVALVDELAHTNVPGSRNEKRWQDIHDLLDAGIDVISTVNIQHLESLNDVVEAVTGGPGRCARRGARTQACPGRRRCAPAATSRPGSS